MKNGILKKFLAFVLCTAMIVTFMPSSVFTLADDGSVDNVAVQEEATPEKTSSEDKVMKTAEAPDTEAAETQEPAEVDEPKPEGEAESPEVVDESSGEEQAAPEAEPVEQPAEGEEAKEEETKEDGGLNKEKLTFNGSENSVDVYVVAQPGTFPEGTTMTVTPVAKADVQDAVESAMGGEAKNFKAVDITFYANGEKVEPKKEVSVRLTTKAFKSDEDLAVVHVEDPDKNKAQVMDLTKVSDTVAQFRTDGFSVYVVVETEVPRLTVKFNNGGTNIETMYVKAADSAAEVEKIIHDPGAGELPTGQVFKGWTTEEQYTADTELMTIEQVRSDAMERATALTNKDGEVNYYAAVFKQYNITYVDGAGITVGTETAEIPSRETEALYTVNQGYSTDDSHNFEGWIVADGNSNIKGYPAGAQTETVDGQTVYYYTNGTEITVTGDVKFSVDAPEGHWLVFDENGKGATYNAPQFIKSGETTSDEGLLDMVRKGYTFDGWYTGAPATTGGDPTGEVFEFGNTINETTTIYAKWKSETKANYTVLIWKQNVKGDGYDFYKSIPITDATVGSVPNAVVTSGSGNNAYATIDGTAYRAGSSDPTIKEDFTGFHYSADDQSTKTVATEGNTVVNVLYDRNEITYTFYTWGSPAGYYEVSGTEGAEGNYFINSDGTGRVYVYFHNGLWYTERTQTGGGSGCEPATYEYSGDTYEKVYEHRGASGNRWTAYKTFKGLYGSTLADNGYTWPTEYDWYDGHDSDRNGNIDTTRYSRTTFLDAFLIPSGVDSEDFYGKTPETGNSFIEFYKQKVDGSYERANRISTTSGQQGVSFSISDKYDGFKASHYTLNGQTVQLGEKDSDGYYATGINYTNSTLRIYFNRLSYTLNFMDGAYVDGNNNPIEEAKQPPFREVDDVVYGASLASYNKGGADYFTPDAPAGYVFEGWYLDEACTQPYTFTTMPEGGLTVYAKWRQIQYRVFLHPNAGTDSTLDWGSETQAMNFRRSYGEKISVPTGLRRGYEFYGWYTDEACTKAFTANTVLNESTVTTPYDKTTHMTDPMDKWGNGATTNSDAENDRFWITKEFNLYAKWSSIVVGADGIGVSYDANGGSSAPSDTKLYKDNSLVSAGAAAKPPTGKEFDHWVLQTWNGSAYVDTATTVLPGATFTILKSDAKITDASTGDIVDPEDVEETGRYKYTVMLKAVYKDKGVETPTHIDWYSNYGSANEGKGELYRSDTGIKINEAVAILGAQTREGYTFKGWTKSKGGTTADFLVWTGSKYTATVGGETVDATHVAADEKQPYEDLFAVWEENEVTINYAVADDSTDMGTVSPTSETVKVSSGTATGSTATAASDAYVFDCWTCDNGTESISTDAHFIPSKNTNNLYEAHTYYAHFKQAEAPVIVHHYLKGTDAEGSTPIKVKDDDTTTATIGSEYTATPATTYQGLDLTVDSYNPTQPVTIHAGDNVITIYYTLPLEITAKSDSKPYDGTALTKNDYEITDGGLLPGDEISSVTVTGSQTLVGSSNNVPSNAEVVTKSGEGEGATETPAPYYVITYKNGTLTVTDVNVTPSLVVNKSHTAKEGEDTYAEGETVTFNISVKNIYATTKTITLSEIEGVTLTQSVFNNVEAGETVTTTATYTITAADMAAGSFTNTVTATLEGKTYTDTDTVNTVTMDAKLTVEKTANPTSGVEVGQTVNYEVKVTNSGNVTVTGIDLTDALMPEAKKPAAFDLAPGANKTVTYSYTVTQADVDAGQIKNTATAKGKDPKNADVTGTATATVTTVAANAELTVEKTANPTSGVTVGSQITYTVKVKNSGNVTVTGIDLADALMPEESKPEAFDLAPNGDETFTYTYTVTQNDVDAGKVDNTATATGKDPKNADVTGTGTATVTTVDSAAALTVEKTAAPTEGVKKGDLVTYTVKVTNSGNVTIKDIVLGDSLVTLTDAQKAVGTLAPRAEKVITYTYTVTQADVDAGKIDNTATATGKDPKNNLISSSDNAEVKTVTAAPELRVQKTGSPASGVKVGDTVKYTVTVTNIGNVTVNDIVLGDTLVTLTDEQKAVGTLAPNESKEITYTYTVTQANVDAGEFYNTATATGKDPSDKDVTGTATARVKAKAADAKLTVEKTANPTEGVAKDDTVTYTVKVTNSGNVTVKGITLSDTLVTLTGENAQAFDLAPGAHKDITYTYTVTQANVDAGTFDNTATATGKDPKNNNVTANDTATVTTVAADAALTVTKNADKTENASKGDTVTYTVTVTNSGNVTVSDIALSDSLVTLTNAQKAVGTLAPGAHKTITYTYEVTQANVDAGKINNTATATGKDPKNNNVTASASKEVTTVAARSVLEVTKTASPTSGVAKDGTVTYTVKVKNNGNVTVKDGTLSDDHADLSDKTFELAPGAETEPITYTYTVTQADVDAGTFTNTVKANATAARGDNPEEATAQATVTTVEPAAKLSVTKEASKTQSIKLNDVITYTVVVTNTGNVSVNAGRLVDDHVDLSAKTFELAPGASATITYPYTVTQADIDAGSVTNIVKANATAVRGANPAEVTATSTATADESGAALEITKTASPTANVKVNDTVTYTIKVKNAGDVTVNNVDVTDQLDGIQLGNPDKTTLKPGEEATVTGTYTVRQADVDAGKIDNTATATATAARGAAPKPVTASATVTTVAPSASIRVTKDADDSIKQKIMGVNVGETITYTVVVENTGNVSVTNGAFDDTLVSLAGKTFSLAPGAKETITYEYTVTQADIDSTTGKISNTVTATANAARVETPVRATDSEEVKTAAQKPELTVVKTADPKSGVGVGDTVNYEIVVTNSGNVTVTGIDLADALMPAAKKPAAFDLAPGEDKTVTYSYIVTQADVDAGKVENTAVATGKDPKNADITANDKVTVTTEAAEAEISITKTANQEAGYNAGDEISYTVVVSNTGNVTVNNVTVSDDHVQLSETPFELAPGTSKTINYTYEATQTDFDNGSITNVASATAKAARGNNPAKVTDDATVQAKATSAAIKVTKTANPDTGVKAGDTVTYSVVVENKGTVSVKEGTLSDDHADLSGKTFSLAPGAKTDPITYTYTVTQADVDAGQIVNVVTAGAKAARGTDPTDVTDTATVKTVAKNAHLTVTKTSDVAAGSTASLGQTIIYTINVKNDGNVTISDITATDTVEGLDPKNVLLDKTKLAPGETATGVFRHVVTEDDILEGQVVNTATAAGKDPQGNDPTVVDGEKTDKTDKKKPSLKVDKTTTSRPANGSKYVLGETISYRITVTNNGNVTIDSIELTDTVEGYDSEDITDSLDKKKLEPGESAVASFTHVVTEQDIVAGSVVNNATANGKDPKDDEPTVDPGKKEDPTDEQKPAVSITKTADRTTGVTVGSRVNYTITVENTGNVTLNNVRVADTLVAFSGNSGTIASLAPGATATLRYAYTATAANIAAGRIVNTATVTGTAPNDTSVTDSASVTATTRVIPGGGGDNPDNPGGGGGNPGGGGGNPAGGQVAPTVVPDEPVPTVEPEVDIVDPEPPLAEGVWALINLIAAILTTLGAIVALFRRKEEEDEEDEEQTAYNAETAEEDEEDKDNRSIKMLTAKIVGALAGIAAPIVFMVTEDMSLPMALVDKWTVLMVVLLAVQIVAAALNKRASRLDDDDKEGAEQPAN